MHAPKRLFTRRFHFDERRCKKVRHRAKRSLSSPNALWSEHTHTHAVQLSRCFFLLFWRGSRPSSLEGLAPLQTLNVLK